MKLPGNWPAVARIRFAQLRDHVVGRLRIEVIEEARRDSSTDMGPSIRINRLRAMLGEIYRIAKWVDVKPAPEGKLAAGAVIADLQEALDDQVMGMVREAVREAVERAEVVVAHYRRLEEKESYMDDAQRADDGFESVVAAMSCTQPQDLVVRTADHYLQRILNDVARHDAARARVDAE